ncbi:MAG: helix-turn-helix domain-containing protein [Proteobacteria bacterium]|nr:helix-turn-helix domain-containing protein [Pseudomonadota bacterium]MBU1611824.1 helix-turn-helix domain-containing protein [Pseudomonadota bacterium]
MKSRMIVGEMQEMENMVKAQQKIDKEQKKRVFENARQVWLFVTGELGLRVSENTVRNHIEAGKLRPRKGGGFSEKTVRSYASNVWPKQVDQDPEKDTPTGPADRGGH